MTLSDLLKAGPDGDNEIYTRALESAIWGILQYRKNPMPFLKTALTERPNGLIAVSTKFFFFIFSGHKSEDLAAQLRPLATHLVETPRHWTLFAEALLHLHQGNTDEAIALLDIALAVCPCNILALRVLTDILLIRGSSEQLAYTIALVEPFYRPDPALRPFVLGMLSFGLEERGDYEAALAMASDVLRAGPSPWALHTVSHVHYEMRMPSEGLAAIEATKDDWEGALLLASHIMWHKALFLVELGRLSEATELYMSYFMPLVQADPNEKPLDVFPLSDATALLWRLRILGVDVSSQWELVERHWLVMPSFTNFFATHQVLAVSVVNPTALQRWNPPTFLGSLASSLQRWIQQGDAAGCAEGLLPILRRHREMGGSRAQTDILARTFLAACEETAEGSVWRDYAMTLRALSRIYNANII